MESTLTNPVASTSAAARPEPTASSGSPATTVASAPVSRAQRWTGLGLTAFIGLFLVFDCAIKLLQLASATQGTVELGYPASSVFFLGVVELVCLVAYLIPRTSVLGAVLLTGYLGGAIATHVRIGNPLFTHVLFPVYVAAFIWGGLYLRDRGLRAFLPFRRQA
jgi:DoxX-like family